MYTALVYFSTEHLWNLLKQCLNLKTTNENKILRIKSRGPAKIQYSPSLFNLRAQGWNGHHVISAGKPIFFVPRIFIEWSFLLWDLEKMDKSLPDSATGNNPESRKKSIKHWRLRDCLDPFFHRINNLMLFRCTLLSQEGSSF